MQLNTTAKSCRNTDMNGYIEIEIIWNGEFNYAGCYSVRSHRVEDGKYKAFLSQENGFNTIQDAFAFAESLVVSKEEHYIIIDMTSV